MKIPLTWLKVVFSWKLNASKSSTPKRGCLSPCSQRTQIWHTHINTSGTASLKRRTGQLMKEAPPPSRKEFSKIHGDSKVLVDQVYPLSNFFERQKKGTKMNYNAQNKQMIGVEYSKASEEIIIVLAKNIKPLLHKVLGIKPFMLRLPEEEASNASMRKHK